MKHLRLIIFSVLALIISSCANGNFNNYEVMNNHFKGCYFLEEMSTNTEKFTLRYNEELKEKYPLKDGQIWTDELFHILKKDFEHISGTELKYVETVTDKNECNFLLERTRADSFESVDFYFLETNYKTIHAYVLKCNNHKYSSITIYIDTKTN